MLLTAIKAALVEKFQKAPGDTGSSRVQVALLSANIKSLTEHLKVHKKDLHSMRGLVRMVNRRRKLLNYLKRTKPAEYLEVIKELEIRK
jgi:small subunit ribosomal protein S15